MLADGMRENEMRGIYRLPGVAGRKWAGDLAVST